MPMLNVFRRDGGAIRHFWGSELLVRAARAGSGVPRITTPLDPVWNLFDLHAGGARRFRVHAEPSIVDDGVFEEIFMAHIALAGIAVKDFAKRSLGTNG